MGDYRPANRNANVEGKIIYSSAGPRSMTMGKDTGRDATNCIEKLSNAGDMNDLYGTLDEVTPAASSHSRNRGNPNTSY